jgi:hypothetical protein
MTNTRDTCRWKYGAVKNVELKEHPCFLPYEQLADADKLKDYMFVTTVRVMAAALGHPAA